MPDYTFETSVVTIRDVEHEVTVQFDYSPPEEQCFDPLKGEGSPGSDASVEFLSVDTTLNNMKVLNFVDSSDQLPKKEWDLLEMRALEHVESVAPEERYE